MDMPGAEEAAGLIWFGPAVLLALDGSGGLL